VTINSVTTRLTTREAAISADTRCSSSSGMVQMNTTSTACRQSMDQNRVCWAEPLSAVWLSLRLQCSPR